MITTKLNLQLNLLQLHLDLHHHMIKNLRSKEMFFIVMDCFYILKILFLQALMVHQEYQNYI